MSLFGAIGISASGMSAERLRMDVTADNLANADSTKGANGQPYQRQEVVLAAGNPNFSEMLGQAQAGVRVDGIVSDPTPGRQVYDPTNPDAPVTRMRVMICPARSEPATSRPRRCCH